MRNAISRRRFLELSGLTAGLSLAPGWMKPLLADPITQNERFFLFVYLEGGADLSYLFDARPLEMTAGGRRHAYLNEEPSLWTGTNDNSCWATSLADPLKNYRNRFSVINGVTMDLSFDGHPQNYNLLTTGNSFGGEIFLPHLTANLTHPLDALSRGSLPSDISNSGKIVNIEPGQMTELKNKIREAAFLNGQNPAYNYIHSRMATIGQGAGRFSAGSRVMAESYHEMVNLADLLLKLEIPPDEGGGGDDGDEAQKSLASDRKFLGMVFDCWRKKITRAAYMQVDSDNGGFDTHDAESAKTSPTMFRSVADRLEQIYSMLEKHPYDDNRSMWDVTTVMVTTEFGRTMRIHGETLDNTGTNHNPLTNTVLLGGGGLKGGLVLGASDFQTSQEVVSGAHQRVDPLGEKIMGRPFDFTSFRPREDKPDTIKVEDYLNIGSVVNTIYELNGVNRQLWRKFGRSDVALPSLRPLF